MSTREPRYRRIDEPLIPPLFIGLAIAIVSVFFLLAIFSYDYRDYSDGLNSGSLRNLIGPVGAVGSRAIVILFGAVSYILPFVTLTYGLAWIFDELAFLRKRWRALACLVFSLLAFFGLHTGEFDPIAKRLDIPNPAGFFGDWFGARLFGLLGVIGGSLLAIVLYVYSLISISNFKFYAWALDKIDWIRRADQMDASRFARDRTREALAGPIGQLPNPEEEEESAPSKSTSRKKSRAKRATPTKKGNVFGGAADSDGDESQGASAVEVEAVEVEPVVRDHSAPRSGEVEIDDDDEVAEPVDQLDEDEPAAIPSDSDALEDEPKVAIFDETDDDAPVERPRASAADILGRTSPDAASLEDVGDEVSVDDESESDDTDAGGDEDSIAEDEDEDSVADKKIRFQPANRERPLSPHRVAPVPTIDEDYKLPDMSHLQVPEWKGDTGEGREELIENARKMQRTLAQFKIEVTLGEITRGPTITRYEMLPAPGVKLEKIVSLSNNIAAALQAQRISILAPIPGKSAVGIEAPNRVKTTVNMRDLMESSEWRESKAKIPLVLGKDVYGKAIIADLADMPHLLIAGATGAGKSVCINAIIASLLYRFRPDEMRFVMIDPKVVELQQYNKLPHLVIPVVNDPKKVILALRWVVNEMEKRYKIFATVGVRNIHSFNRRRNKKPKESAQPELPMGAAPTDGFAVDLDDEIAEEEEGEIEIPDRLSYVVVIIDELADLMLVAPSDVEMSIARITQMARAAGIHCIVATQRPSVDVITGVIKANIPCRIGFQVASKVDSRTILDTMGADKLLGKGDMLYLPPGSAQPIRAQGVFITDEEIDSIVEFIKRQSSPTYDEEIHSQIEKPQADVGRGDASDEDEELIEKSIDIIRVEQKASVSLIQRRLRIGYTRAARIMDTLEDRGIVGPRNGAEPREILIDLDEEL